MADEIEFHQVGEEWTAVYLNGQLQRVGDSYLADEWLQEHFGVKQVYDSACMIDDFKAYPTLAEVNEATRKREERMAEAEELEQRAAELKAQAEAMRR